eukprot:356791-Chlamydomonas_euryale.AAC.5
MALLRAGRTLLAGDRLCLAPLVRRQSATASIQAMTGGLGVAARFFASGMPNSNLAVLMVVVVTRACTYRGPIGAGKDCCGLGAGPLGTGAPSRGPGNRQSSIAILALLYMDDDTLFNTGFAILSGWPYCQAGRTVRLAVLSGWTVRLAVLSGWHKCQAGRSVRLAKLAGWHYSGWPYSGWQYGEAGRSVRLAILSGWQHCQDGSNDRLAVRSDWPYHQPGRAVRLARGVAGLQSSPKTLRGHDCWFAPTTLRVCPAPPW